MQVKPHNSPGAEEARNSQTEHCKFCHEPVSLSDEPIYYPDSTCAHEDCAGAFNKPVRADVTLSDGRVVKQKRMANGATDAYFDDGRNFSSAELREYNEIVVAQSNREALQAINQLSSKAFIVQYDIFAAMSLLREIERISRIALVNKP
jgi:hypothetical protein